MALSIGELVAYLRTDDSKLAQGLRGAEEKVKGAGERIRTGLKVAGAAAGAALTASLAQNMDISAGRAKLAGQLGLSQQDSAKIGAVAGKVYADNWGENLDQVNEAIAAVNSNLGNVGRMGAADLQKVTEAALALSSTFNVDVGESTKAAGQLIRNGLAKNSTEAFDIITRGFQTGLNRSDDFLDTLNEYSPQFAKLGIDGPHALALIQAGLQGGARDTDSIADAFKEFSLRAIDGSSTTAQGFKAIGLDAKKAASEIGKGGPAASAMTTEVLQRLAAMKDPVQQNIAGVALFGTQWEDTLRKALPQVAAAKDGMEGVKGATQRMADTVGNTAQGKIDSFKRGMEQWVQGLTNGTSTLGTMTAGVLAFGGPALAMAGTFGQIAAGMAAFNLESMIAAVKTGIVTVATGAWSAAQWLLNAALNANPIGLVVLAIAALVAVFIYAWKNSETFRNIVLGAWEMIKTAGLAIWAGIVWYIRTYVGAIMTVVHGIMAVVDWFRNAFGRAKDAAVSKGVELVLWVNGLPGRIARGLGNLGNLLYGKGQEMIRGLIDGVKSMAASLYNETKSVLGPIGNLLPGSPVKAGPLRVLNNGYAGGQIIRMVAGGIDAAAPRLESAATSAVARIPLPRTGSGSVGTVPAGPQPGRSDLYLHGSREAVAFVKSLVRDYGGGSVVTAFEG